MVVQLPYLSHFENNKYILAIILVHDNQPLTNKYSSILISNSTIIMKHKKVLLENKKIKFCKFTKLKIDAVEEMDDFLIQSILETMD